MNRRIRDIARDPHSTEGQFIKDLARRVAIRTESQVPESRPCMDVYLKEEIAPAFDRMGFKVEILPNPVEGVGPILLAERIEDPSLPTVLSYGHGDVIRGLEGQWREGLSPWKLKQEGERYYGRGSADNKAQHSINMAALATVITERGRLGFNAKFMLETGEEHLLAGAARVLRAAPRAIEGGRADRLHGPRVSAKRPTLYLGSRGSMNFTFTVELREGAHHSGNWGGLLANPGIVLAHALASIVTRKAGCSCAISAGPHHGARATGAPRLHAAARSRGAGNRCVVGRAGTLRGGKGLCLEHFRDTRLSHRESRQPRERDSGKSHGDLPDPLRRRLRSRQVHPDSAPAPRFERLRDGENRNGAQELHAGDPAGSRSPVGRWAADRSVARPG